MDNRKTQLRRTISWAKLVSMFIEDQREVFKARLILESAEEETRRASCAATFSSRSSAGS